MCSESLGGAFAEGHGLIVRRRAPRLGRTLDRALAAGTIQAVLPGIYAPAGDLDLALRARAAMERDPDAVVTGASAAALTWWPELKAPLLEVASRAHRAKSAGFRWHQQRVPAEHVVEQDGVRFTNVPLTVLDLLPVLWGDPIDEALRRRVVTLGDLWDTLGSMPHRPGDQLRRRLLQDSRDEPWSGAERRLHRIVRGLGLPCGYATNHTITLPDGSLRYIDLALPDLLLGFEVDGWEFHGTREAFRKDRASDANLATMGWQRIRFDAEQVFDEEAEVGRTLAAVVAAREALFRGLAPFRARGRKAP